MYQAQGKKVVLRVTMIKVRCYNDQIIICLGSLGSAFRIHTATQSYVRAKQCLWTATFFIHLYSLMFVTYDIDNVIDERNI